MGLEIENIKYGMMSWKASQAPRAKKSAQEQSLSFSLCVYENARAHFR